MISIVPCCSIHRVPKRICKILKFEHFFVKTRLTHNDVVNDAIDVVPSVGFVLPFWKCQSARALRPKLDALAPKLDLGINGAMEDKGVAFTTRGMPRRNGRVMPDLLANEAKIVLPQFVRFTQQRIERFTHALKIGGQGTDGESGHPFQAVLTLLGRRRLFQQVRVVHVL